MHFYIFFVGGGVDSIQRIVFCADIVASACHVVDAGSTSVVTYQ